VWDFFFFYFFIWKFLLSLHLERWGWRNKRRRTPYSRLLECFKSPPKKKKVFQTTICTTFQYDSVIWRWALFFFFFFLFCLNQMRMKCMGFFERDVEWKNKRQQF
jgi:hypothetical protein